MDIDLKDGPEPGTTAPGTAGPLSTTPDVASTTSEPAATSEPAVAVVPRTRRPPAITALSAILLVSGGAIEGYALALTGDSVGRQYSLVWAFLGSALVITAWALRGRRWWGAAAAIGVSIVGLFAGMYGIYGLLVLTSAAADDRANWATTVGLVAVGAASIASIGLLSSAWLWLTTGPTSRSTPAGSQPV